MSEYAIVKDKMSERYCKGQNVCYAIVKDKMSVTLL